jgi:hypothetical protein
VLRLVVGEGMKLALIGIRIGLLGGLALGRAVSSLVFGVHVRDPLTFIDCQRTATAPLEDELLETNGREAGRTRSSTSQR